MIAKDSELIIKQFNRVQQKKSDKLDRLYVSSKLINAYELEKQLDNN